MLIVLLSIVMSEDMRNKRTMDANLQTNSRQWSSRLENRRDNMLCESGRRGGRRGVGGVGWSERNQSVVTCQM